MSIQARMKTIRIPVIPACFFSRDPSMIAQHRLLDFTTLFTLRIRIPDINARMTAHFMGLDIPQGRVPDFSIFHGVSFLKRLSRAKSGIAGPAPFDGNQL